MHLRRYILLRDTLKFPFEDHEPVARNVFVGFRGGGSQQKALGYAADADGNGVAVLFVVHDVLDKTERDLLADETVVRSLFQQDFGVLGSCGLRGV